MFVPTDASVYFSRDEFVAFAFKFSKDANQFLDAVRIAYLALRASVERMLYSNGDSDYVPIARIVESQLPNVSVFFLDSKNLGFVRNSQCKVLNFEMLELLFTDDGELKLQGDK